MNAKKAENTLTAIANATMRNVALLDARTAPRAHPARSHTAA